MRNFSVKSLVLGIGIGIIITSIVSIIYLAGANPNSEISREEIIRLARGYGMIDGAELLKSQPAAAERPKPADSAKTEVSSGTKSAEIDNKVEAGSIQAMSQPQPAGTEKVRQSIQKPADEVEASSQRMVKIVINPGDTSETVAEKLLKAGLINDIGAFIRELENEGLTTEIAVGEFSIKNGDGLKAIIKAITWNK